MYSLIESLLSIPSSQYTNSTVSYVAGALALLLAVVVIDLVIRLIGSFLPKGR